MKTKYFKTKLSAMMLLMLSIPLVSQAQIDVDVDINVGEITILYAFTDIDVVIDSSALGAILANGCVAGTLSQECDEGEDAVNSPVTAVETAPGSGILEATFDIDTGLFDPTAVDLVLENVWAVRAIGGATANTTVTATLGADSTLSDGGTSSITVNSADATPATFADPGLGAPQVGDVTLELDLSGIDTAGDHDDGGDTGDVVYTLEVTAN